MNRILVRVLIQKSSLFFSSNTRMDIQDQLLQLVGITECSNLERYLGLLGLMGRAKLFAFYIKTRFGLRLITRSTRIGPALVARVPSKTIPSGSLFGLYIFQVQYTTLFGVLAIIYSLLAII